MKKGTKVILIVAVVMMLTGGIMSVICFILGASWRDLNFGWDRGRRTNYEEARIDVAAVEDVGPVTRAEIADDTGVTEDLVREGTGNADRWWSFTGQEIDSLKLSVDAGEMIVQSGAEYYVEVEHPRDGFRCEIKDGTLVVEEDGPGFSWELVNDNHPVIWVTIPEDTVFKQVECKVGAGSMEAEQLMAETLKVDVDAGSFTGGWIGAEGKMTLDVDAGSLCVYGGACQGKLSVDVDAGGAELWEFEGGSAEFDTDVGSIEYNGVLQGDWKADCDMGSIVIYLNAQKDDYNYVIENDMGSVTLDGQMFAALSDRSNLKNGASYTGTIDCDMGSIEVYFN